MKPALGLFIILAGVAAAANGPSAVTSFKDPNLESAVRKFLPGMKPGEPLAEERLASVILVSAQGISIQDLSGIEACKNLEYLYLSGSPVADLRPLSKLTKLQSISIRGGKVQDLSPLAMLTRLEYLDLTGNHVADLKPLAGLSQLESLHLDGNQISDLTALANLKSLWFLDLKKNRVRDLTPLANLTQLKDLYLDQNMVTDLAPLVTLFEENTKGPKELFPYRTVTLLGNPLTASARSQELAELQKYAFDVQVEKK